MTGDPLHPRTGGRVVLERRQVGPAEVVYGAALYTPAAVWRGRAVVTLADGGVTFDPWDPADPPGWLAAAAQTYLRTAWRARRDAGPEVEPWPQRITRWKEAP